MDNIISRFPGLAERIFDTLDDENLGKSKTVKNHGLNSQTMRCFSGDGSSKSLLLAMMISKKLGN